MGQPSNVLAEQVLEKLNCELITTKVDDFEQMSYTTYGMHCTDSKGKTVERIEDISTDKDKVLGFIKLINNHDVAAIHIRDILDDYLD